MKKAVFFDIDGTLLDTSKGVSKITSPVKDAIRELQNNDILVFVSSGRPYAFLNEDILTFGFDGYILMNGSLILLNDNKSNNLKPFYKNNIKKEHLKELICKFENYNMEYILEDEKYSYLKNDFKTQKAFYERIDISMKYIKHEYDIKNINACKIEMHCLDEEAYNFCKTLEDDNFRYTYFDDFKLFELYSRKDTKASGIMRILDHFNIDINSSFAFGDSHNDIEMLNAVGCGIVMGNALDEIKDHGDKITKSVSEDGVAYGINNYILNK